MAFSPDRELLASGSTDETIRFWYLNEAGEIAVLEGHDAAVPPLAFTPDGATAFHPGP